MPKAISLNDIVMYHPSFTNRGVEDAQAWYQKEANFTENEAMKKLYQTASEFYSLCLEKIDGELEDDSVLEDLRQECQNILDENGIDVTEVECY